MTLASALECATRVGGALRALHARGEAHGKVTAANVALLPEGVELLPARYAAGQSDARRDIREFGGLLFHMLTGRPLKWGELPAASPTSERRCGPAGVGDSMLQVAASCLREGDFQPTMQQVLTELRLLALLLKMQAKDEPPAPFLVKTGPQAAHSTPAAVVPLVLNSFGNPSDRPPAEAAPRGGPCPRCECATVYVSRARSDFESLLVKLRVPLCRCHRCLHRYFAISRFKIGKDIPAVAAVTN
jgi:hypothetical protein